MSAPRFHPEALRELREAVDLLEAESPALARRVGERTEATIGMLQTFPEAGRHIGELNRRFPVRPFPYHLVYLPAEENIYIVAFAHERREPDYWRARAIE